MLLFTGRGLGSTQRPSSPPPIGNEIDAASAALIAQLALQDLAEVTAARNGTSTFNAPLSDEEYAYQLQAENFMRWLSVPADAEHTHSFDAATATDAPFLDATIVAEAAAADDRRMAMMLSRGEPLPPPTASQALVEHPEFKMPPEPSAATDMKGKGTAKSDNREAEVDLSENDSDIYTDSESVEGDLDSNDDANVLDNSRAHPTDNTAESSGSSSSAGSAVESRMQSAPQVAPDMKGKGKVTWALVVDLDDDNDNDSDIYTDSESLEGDLDNDSSANGFAKYCAHRTDTTGENGCSCALKWGVHSEPPAAMGIKGKGKATEIDREAEASLSSSDSESCNESIEDDLDFDSNASMPAKFGTRRTDSTTSGSTSSERGAHGGSSPAVDGMLLTDEEYAYKLQLESIAGLVSVSSDEQYARSLDAAVATDAAIVKAAIVSEAAAFADRRMAILLSRGEALPPPTETQRRVERAEFKMHPEPPAEIDTKGKGRAKGDYREAEDDLLDGDSDTDSLEGDLDFDNNAKMLAQFRARRTDSTAENGAGSSAQGAKLERRAKVDCIICDDSIFADKALLTACNHYYCRTCVESLVENFTRDESLFPLRCCKEPILVRTVIPFISAELRTLFLKKHSEFSVPSKDRIYCSNPSCSVFLLSSTSAPKSAKSVVCRACRSPTCLRCKQASHPGKDCPADVSSVQLRAIALSLGWQTCPGCSAVVELSLGCYHMTCRCRFEFCYLCAAPWKTCQCEQWDENKLLEAAQHRVENDLGRRLVRKMAPVALQNQVRQVVEVLRNDHQCAGHFWTYRVGGGQCEECNFNLPTFLLLCRNCSRLACRQCTQNRL